MADPLAIVADLEGRLGRTFTGEESARAALLLADASAAVRAYTGQLISAATSTARLLLRDGKIRPSQRPIVTVVSVADMDAAVLDHVWYAGPTITVEAAVTDGIWVDLTYDHGFDPVPDDIVAVVCQVAGRAFGVPADQGGISQETIGNYSYSISGTSRGATAAAGTVGFLNDERAVLDRYRQPLGMVRYGP